MYNKPFFFFRCDDFTSLISDHENYQSRIRFRLFLWQCKKVEENLKEALMPEQ